MPTDDELFTPAEVLGGFSAKRARLLLFQIESRTAYLMMESRRTVDLYLTEEIAEQQNLAFFEALGEGRELPVRPTIHDLERYALQWQSLVPHNLTLQATLAHLLAEKYRLTQRDIPHIREAVGLDSEGLQQAFQLQYHQPLEMIYSRQLGLLNWVRWRWNKLGVWLENLPPFWTAYALTFTETVGASILALPIALAGLGPLPGVVILFVMGVINTLTIAAMAEAVTRSGSIRYQGSYLGRLVGNYLGRPGSILLTTTVVAFTFMLLFAYYLGFSLTLAAATPIPPEAWAGVLFLLGIYFVRQKTLQATVTSALVVGAINLGLVLILSLLALGHFRLEHLLYVHVPFLNDTAFEPALLGLVFGVAFTAYFGHFSVNSCARTMLQRDPSGRSLTQGCVAAQASVLVLYILWVVAVNGAIAPQALTGFSGTALGPLATLVGPAVIVLGTIYAILAMGMASIHFSLALFLTVREWIPGQARHTLVLGRRQGKLMLTPRGKTDLSLTLTYLGLKAAQPQFRLGIQREGDTRHFEIGMQTTWEARNVLAEVTPKLPAQGIDLALKIVTASAESVRVQVVTSMRLVYEGGWDTLGLDVLEMAGRLDTPDTALVRWLAGRKQTSVEEVASFLDQTEQASQMMLNRLVEQGALSEAREQGQTVYQVHFAARRRRQATPEIWQALDAPGAMAGRRHDASVKKGMRLKRMKELAQGEYGRFWLGLSPLILLFLLTEWLLVKRLESFSQVVGFVGVVAVPVVAGVFPVLLLLASRRKGEHVPGFVLRFLAHPVVVSAIYLVSVGMLFLHGLLIWQDPFQRVLALLVGVVVLGTTYLMARQGAFARRLVIEIRQDSVKEDAGTFMVTDSGQVATSVIVKLGYADAERVYQTASGVIPEFPTLYSATIHIHETKAQELKVWLHRVTPEGHSEYLTARVKVSSGKDIREFQVDGVGKQFVLPLRDAIKREHQESETNLLTVEVEFTAHTREETDTNDSKPLTIWPDF